METQTQIQEKVRRNREVLQDLCLQVAGNVRLETLLNRIVTLVVDSMKVRRASIMTVEEGRYLQIRASHGIMANIVRSTRVPLGEGISGRVAVEGKPMVIRDVSDVQILERDEEVQYKTNSFICMPLLFAKKVNGVINVTDKVDGSPFDYMDMELLTMISSYTALLLQNYGLYHRLRRTVSRLKSTNQKYSASTRRMEAFINNSADAIVNVDGRGRIVMYNEPATQYFSDLKRRRSIFTAMPCREFATWLREQHLKAVCGESTTGEFELEFLPGHTVIFRVQSIPSDIFKSQEIVDIHVMHRFIDVTFHRSMEDRKREFMALMSHELRTPLTVLKSYLKILVGQLRTSVDQDIQEMLDTMMISVERLQREVSKVMIMSQLDNEDYEVDNDLMDFGKLVTEVQHSLTSEAEEGEIRMVYQGTSEELVVWGDHRLLKLAVENLLKNAIQHSPPASEIVIVCRKAKMKNGDTGIRLEISDQGPGLSSRDMQRILGRLEQVQHHLTRSTGGLGLGLSIVRRIIELSGGELLAWSAPGKGSRFGFEIPVVDEGDVS